MALAQAQAVQRRHLITSIGGGTGVATLDLSADSLDLELEGCGVVRFACGYALGDRWSLGVHYDRIGRSDLPDAHGMLRFTTYAFTGTFRPWIGDKATVEAHLALGTSILAWTPRDARLPLEATSGIMTFGLRYIRMFGGVIGGFLAVDHTASGSGPLLSNGTVLRDRTDKDISAVWDAQRLTGGMVVRF